jgi:hypothetical protein
MPSESNIDATRNKHDTNTGTRCISPKKVGPSVTEKVDLTIVDDDSRWRETHKALRAPHAL